MASPEHEDERSVDSNHGGDSASSAARDVRGVDGGHNAPASDGSASTELDHRGGQLARGWTEPEQGFQPGAVAGQPALVGLTDFDLGDEELPRRALQQVIYSHSGPIPEPGTLARYGEVDASFPGRIVRMAETEVDTRSKTLMQASSAEAFAVRLGAVGAVALPLLGLGAAVWLLMAGYEIAGIVTLAPLVITAGAKLLAAARKTPPPTE